MIKNDKIFLCLNDNVILVEGKYNSAIYNFNNGLIYSINSESTEFIHSLIKNKSLLTEEQSKYITKLKDMGLIDENLNLSMISFSQNDSNELGFAWIELTESCNEKCLHCYGEFGCNKMHKDLSLAQWKKILMQLKSVNCNCIQFIGGEPLLYKNFKDILKFAISLNFDSITVFTNGTLITPDLIEIFGKYNIRIKISLYGHNAVVHDSITQIQGSFQKTTDAIKLLKAENVESSIAVIIMKENERYLEDIINFIRESHFGYAGYDVIRKVFGGNQIDHIPSEKILRTKFIEEPDFYANKNFFLRSLFKNTCWDGKCAITAQGDVIPCIFERDKSYGNITKTNLKDILSSEKLIELWQLNKDYVNVCKDCEYRYACKDCRPIAEAEKNDLFDKYSRCVYNPSNGCWEK